MESSGPLNRRPLESRPGWGSLLALLLLASCAHQQNTGLLITGSTLDAAGITFESALAGMESASDDRLLTRDQVLAWNDFLSRWKVAYPDACKAWRAAKAKGDEGALAQATSALGELLTQLNDWAAVLSKTKESP